MARVKTVLKARKSPGVCGKCAAPIKAGESYKWWKFRYGGKYLRCAKCPYPRPSETESNEKRSNVYAVEEAVQDAIDEFRKTHDVAVFMDSIASAASDLREVASEFQESADNISQYFSSSDQVNEFEETAQHLEGVADEMDSAADGLEAFEAPETKDEKEIQKAKDRWEEEVVSAVDDYTDIELPY